jgi:hypothetical protein
LHPDRRLFRSATPGHPTAYAHTTTSVTAGLLKRVTETLLASKQASL